MKSMIALGISLLAGYAHAATPAVPKDLAACKAAIADHNFCTETEIPSSSFPFTVRFFVVVEKEVYPTVEALLDKYLAFDQWPAYSDSVGSDSIIFNSSQRMSDLATADGSLLARHYYDYRLKSPIGYQKVRGVTFNHRLPVPYTGSLATIEFEAQVNGPQEVPAGEKPLNGAEGVKLQTGIINARPCPISGLCTANQWLLIYETTLTPAISLLPKVAASSVEQGLETVLVGMLFN